MAKTKTLGSAIVRFLSQGIGKLKAEIGSVQGSVANLATANERNQRRMARAAAVAARQAGEAKAYWDNLGNSFTRVGRMAIGTLGIATAAATGFARMADPRGFDMLGIAFTRVGIQVGRLFVPAIRALTVWVERAADFMRNLSDETRETIVQWMKWGAATLLAVGGFAIFSGIVLRLVGHLRVLTFTIGRIGAALAAVGFAPWILGIVAVGAALAAITGGFSGIGDAARGLLSAGQSVFASLREALAPYVRMLVEFGQAILPSVISAFQALAGVGMAVGQLFIALAEALRPLVGILLQVVESILPILTAALSAVLGVVTLLISGITWLVETFGTFGLTTAATIAALLLIPLAIGRIVSGFWSLVSMTRAIITGVRAMSATMAAFVASPWGAAIAAIALAVGALVSAFSAAGGAVDDLSGRMARLDDLARRLRSGGTLTREDLVRALPTADVDRLMAITDPAARRAEARRMMEDRRSSLDGMPTMDESTRMEGRIRDVLMDSRDVFVAGATTTAPRHRHGVRRDRLLAAGIPEATVDALGDLGSDSIGGPLSFASPFDSGLTPERIEEIIRGAGPSAPRRRREAEVETLRAVSEGRMESGDRFRGEMRHQAAQFVGILDLARKIQTAQADTPEAMRHRELLEATRGIALDMRAVAAHTATLPAMRGVVPGRP